MTSKNYLVKKRKRKKIVPCLSSNVNLSFFSQGRTKPNKRKLKMMVDSEMPFFTKHTEEVMEYSSVVLKLITHTDMVR